MAHRVVKCLSVLVAFAVPQPLWAQAQTYAHQLTLLMPPDPADRQIAEDVKLARADRAFSNDGDLDALRAWVADRYAEYADRPCQASHKE